MRSPISSKSGTCTESTVVDAAGIDAMPLAELGAHLKVHWPHIKEELLAGGYQPQAVREVSIPKPNGKGERLLGIPTVTDRLIQQALHQVLSPIFDVDFSEHSYGFRRGRGRSLSHVIAELMPILRGWMIYFCDIEVRNVLEALDDWLRQQAALSVVAAMETNRYPRSLYDATGTIRGTCVDIGH